MDYGGIRYAVAYAGPDGDGEHGVDLLRGAPDETDSDTWIGLRAPGDGTEVADAVLVQAGLRRLGPWVPEEDLDGFAGWYARVETSE